MFLDPMREMGLEVDRPTVPIALELSTDEALLKDPQAYPVKVLRILLRAFPFAHLPHKGDIEAPGRAGGTDRDRSCTRKVRDWLRW